MSKLFAGLVQYAACLLTTLPIMIGLSLLGGARSRVQGRAGRGTTPPGPPSINADPERQAFSLALPFLFGLNACLVQVHVVVDAVDPARGDEVVHAIRTAIAG